VAEGLFDTCVFIDYWRGDVAAQQLVNQAVSGTLDAYFSPITEPVP